MSDVPFAAGEYDRRLIWLNGHPSLMLFDEFLSVAFEEWCLVPRRMKRGKKKEEMGGHSKG